MSLHAVNPDDLPAPRGYNHGLVAPPGARLLFVAGQTAAGRDGYVVPADFVEQWRLALSNVLRVVREAGGAPEHVARLTIYVTDLDAYRKGLKPLGAVWRELMGRHYPAMALVEVARLVDPAAVVEMEATAVLAP